MSLVSLHHYYCLSNVIIMTMIILTMDNITGHPETSHHDLWFISQDITKHVKKNSDIRELWWSAAQAPVDLASAAAVPPFHDLRPLIPPLSFPHHRLNSPREACRLDVWHSFPHVTVSDRAQSSITAISNTVLLVHVICSKFLVPLVPFTALVTN